jgi:hypothetical protein
MQRRLRSVLGRLFGLEGWDSSDPRQWPRYLVVRPLVVVLPASLGVLVGAAVAAAVDGGDWFALLLMLVLGVFGFAVGSWAWLARVEGRRPRA